MSWLLSRSVYVCWIGIVYPLAAVEGGIGGEASEKGVIVMAAEGWPEFSDAEIRVAGKKWRKTERLGLERSENGGVWVRMPVESMQFQILPW